MNTTQGLAERLAALADALDRRRYPENAALVREAAAALSQQPAVDEAQDKEPK